MNHENQHEEVPQWLRRKLATAQKAEQFYYALVGQQFDLSAGKMFMEADAKALTRQAFLLAQAFDEELEKYLQPPTIETQPPNLVLR